ncbi:MAG TPA: type I-E CRISPR-associated protein Cse1/CasA [Pseudonocardiaceae bacterium]
MPEERMRSLATFNLVDRPWVPVVAGARGRSEVSVRDALLRADEFDGLSVDFPTQAPAILRQVLLPVLLDALGAPRSETEWSALFGAEKLTGEARERVVDYLDRWRPRFDLFDEQRPFAQVAGLKTTTGDTKPAVSLITTAATGNAVPLHWPYAEDDSPALSAAEAARWLVTVQCWDTAGIKTGAAGDPRARDGKTMGNPTGPLGQLGVVVPTGRNLYETLILNLPIMPHGLNPHDCPEWTRDTPRTAVWRAASQPRGLLGLLTWQSRRIRLFPRVDDDNVVVPRVIIAAGDRLPRTPHGSEPHTTWRMPAKAQKSAARWRPRIHVPGRTGWYGLDSLLGLQRPGGYRFETSRLLNQIGGLWTDDHLPRHYPLRVELVGVAYGTQNAVVEQVITDSIPIPVAALRVNEYREAIVNVYEQAESLVHAANHLSDEVRRASGGDPVPWDKGQRLGEMVLHVLDPLVRRFLTGARGAERDQLRNGLHAWAELACRALLDVVEPLLAAAPPSAFVGRITENSGRELTHRLSAAENQFRYQVGQILNLNTADQAALAGEDQSLTDEEVPLRHRGQWYWQRFVANNGTWLLDSPTHGAPPPGEDLAALRAGLGREPGEVPGMWPFYRAVTPDSGISCDLRAEHHALALYGLHQQSRRTPMHDPSLLSVGAALQKLRNNVRTSAGAVDHWFTVAVSANTVPTLVMHLRGLITQLRSIDQPLNYDRLVEDIYRWQWPRSRQRVRRDWGSAYFQWSAYSAAEDNEPPAAAISCSSSPLDSQRTFL